MPARWYHSTVLADSNGDAFFMRASILAGKEPAMIPVRQVRASVAVEFRQD